MTVCKLEGCQLAEITKDNYGRGISKSSIESGKVIEWVFQRGSTSY